MRTTFSLPFATLLPGVVDQPALVTPHVVSGRSAILRTLPALRAFAEHCGQPGFVTGMEHFLDARYVGAKRPHLLLFYSTAGLNLQGAVLVHQYRMAGVPLRLFVTEDVDGERNVLAPSANRSQIAARAATHLLRNCGAHLAIVSLRDGRFEAAQQTEDASDGTLWASTMRTSQRYLVLGSTLDETLANLGANTRRNLRRSVHKAERELGCTFTPNVAISLPELLAMNARCAYPASDAVARWRYRSGSAGPNAVMMGVRTADGRWLSLMGCRRSHSTLAIDWQMNPTELHSYSPSTVMRSYMIQHEQAQGTAQILFEGGTPHAMGQSLRVDTIADLVAVSGRLPLWLLQRCVAPHLPTYNVLRQTLQQSLQWHRGEAVASASD